MPLPSKARRALAIAILIAAAGMIVYGAFFQQARVTTDPTDPLGEEYTLQGMDLFSKARADGLIREDGKLVDILATPHVVNAPTQSAVAIGVIQAVTDPESPTQASGDSKASTADAGEPETRCPT